MKKYIYILFFGTIVTSSCNSKISDLERELTELKKNIQNEEVLKVDYKRIWIEFDIDINQFPQNKDKKIDPHNHNYIYPSHETEKSKMADSLIKNYLNDGWKIVSTSPTVATSSIVAPADLTHSSITFTNGYEVFLIKEWKKKDLELLKEKEKIKLDSIRKVEKEAEAEEVKKPLSEEAKNNIKKRKF